MINIHTADWCVVRNCTKILSAKRAKQAIDAVVAPLFGLPLHGGSEKSALLGSRSQFHAHQHTRTRCVDVFTVHRQRNRCRRRRSVSFVSFFFFSRSAEWKRKRKVLAFWENNKRRRRRGWRWCEYFSIFIISVEEFCSLRDTISFDPPDRDTTAEQHSV